MATDTKTKTESKPKAKPVEIPAANVSTTDATMIEQSKAALFSITSPMQLFLRLVLSIVRPGGKVEGYVKWKKETGSDKIEATAKPMDDRFVVTASGNTPERIEQSIVASVAKYFARSGGQDKGPAPEQVQERVTKIVNDLLSPEGFRERFNKNAEYLIAEGIAGQQKPSLITIIARRKADDEEPRWSVKTGFRDRGNLDRFLSDIKRLKLSATIKESKDSEELAPEKYFELLKAADELPTETETETAVNQ